MGKLGKTLGKQSLLQVTCLAPFFSVQPAARQKFILGKGTETLLLYTLEKYYKYTALQRKF